MNTTIPCPYCDLYDRDQHSIKRHGICDGIRKGFFRLSKSVVTQLRSAKPIYTLTPTHMKAIKVNMSRVIR
jgi:hypothetical protein